MPPPPPPPMPQKTVMVTGANGFLASYIVRDLLASGHRVHACVRDATQSASVEHLCALTGADERLKLFSTGSLEGAAEIHAFDGPMAGCHAVFHTATPVNVKFGPHSGERDIFQPAMTSTTELLDCVKRNGKSVRCLVLTSSMSAMAPHPEPYLKDESHWSDPGSQKERGNWYGYTKTTQEQKVREFVRQAKSDGSLSQGFVYAAICPTMVIGPPLKPPLDPSRMGGTMGSLQRWLQGGRSQAPNESMSFIHVQDCAKMHTRILELTTDQINPEQRYMSLIESLHWNDILVVFKELYPQLPDYTSYSGDDLAKPTKFNYTNMRSLQINHRSTREALEDAINYLFQVHGLR